ncbi:MAG: polyprenyl synthetase family protein [Chloroflexota bacterium]
MIATEPAMPSYLTPDESALAQVHDYLVQALQRSEQTLGSTLRDACLYAVGPQGKMMRPALMLEACRAVGGKPEQILPAVAGTEYGHTASLIHDDLIDGDGIRRGQEAVHRRFGLDYAVLGGDYLIFQTYHCFTRCAALGVPSDRVLRAIALLSATCMEMCEGQALEAELVGNLDVTRELYLQVIHLKTATFTASAAQIGAVLGGGEEPAIQALGAYGENLGLAFQVIDDLLCYTENADVILKPVVSDLANRRVTLPIIYALEQASPPQQRWLRDLFAAPQPDLSQQPALLDLLRSTGAVARARADAEEFAALARRHVGALPPTTSREHLAGLAGMAVHRHR